MKGQRDPPPFPTFLAGGGEMGARMRAHPWHETPLGPPEAWPSSLKTTVSIVLQCQLPMYLAWGPAFIQFYNDAYRPILGDKHEGALGASAPQVWNEIWPKIGPMWLDVLQGRPIGSDDFELTINRYGYPEDCHFSFSYSPVPDDQGLPHGVLVTFAETTQRVRSERRLKFLDDLGQATRSLNDSADVMTVAARMLGEYLGVNRCAYAHVLPDQDTFDLVGDYNQGVHSIVGRYRFTDFGPVVHQRMLEGLAYVNDDVDHHPATRGTDLAAYRLTQIQAVVCVPLLREGRFIGAMAVHQARPRHWAHDEVELVQTVVERCWEVLERMRVEAALRQAAEERKQLLESERAARAEAERASSTKDEFLAQVSHELRTPLSAILGWTEILRRKLVQTDPDMAKGVEVISRSARIQAKLIEDLLDMSRILNGKLRLEMQALPAISFVQGAVEVIRPTAEANGIELVVTAENGEDTVLGDPGRLQQVIWNLLANAVKFTPRGGRVAVRISGEAACVRVEVEDTGVGIEADMLDRIFDRFHQADVSTTRRYGGLGLGLSIVRSLMQLHGGTVAAFSEGRGRGARFVIELPAKASLGAHGPAPSPLSDLAGLHVLVVDDDADAREAVVRVLQESGATVTSAAGAADALRTLDERVPDVLVSDIGMPEVDGYELIRRVRAGRSVRVPAMALSAFSREEDRERAFQAGFDEYLTKPVEPHRLVQRVSSLARG
jgi:signal transduction histidine kinase